MSEHVCHATGCRTPVPPRMYQCRRHWYMLPMSMRAALWAAYVPGQERRKDPTGAYLEVARECIRYVEEQEAA